MAWRNEGLWMRAMELKVWVDGVQRIVCGVNEFTTCQEVVIALAQAIGKLNASSPASIRCGVVKPRADIQP